MFVMVYGNPVEGFRFVGPFATKAEARKYARGEPFDVWVARLDTPTQRREEVTS
jgi:hypothetical protein